MNYNADQVEKVIRDPMKTGKKAQVGYDITVAKIEKISGIALFEGDSKLNRDLLKYTEAPRVKDMIHILHNHELDGVDIKNHMNDYYLEPNSHYVIEFQQGVELADNEWGFLLQRSSAGRAGSWTSSACWDSMFFTDNMGTTFHTGSVPMIIPIGTRIAQMLIFENYPVSEGYHGQWQGVANH